MAATNGSATLRHIYAPVPQTTRGQGLAIKTDPRGEKLLYCSGKSVVIRSLANPLIADLYQQHAHTVTAAAYSASGFYIASGDESGKVRIWDTVNAEHLLANEYQVLSGRVFDICWSSDNDRLIVVGDGRERYGAAILAKTGASVGSITGHSKTITSCSFKPTRPFRVVTGSEDTTVAFHEGPPFKFSHANQDHTRFINAVAYSPNGERYVACSSDMKASVFEGKSGDKQGELTGEGGHTGSIYACAWSPDSAFLLTASADKTCKVWDMATLTVAQTFTFGSSTDDMQMGCAWAGTHLISISLNGNINFLDRANPSAPARVLQGHNKFITALEFDPTTRTLFSGSYDGRIVAWDFDAATQSTLAGTGHASQVSGMSLSGDSLVSVGMDDTIAVSSVSGRTLGAMVKLDSTPYDVSVAKNDATLAVAVYNGGVAVIRRGAVVSTLALTNSPQAVDISPTATEVAIGCSDGVHTFNLARDTLTAKAALTGQHRAQVVTVQYSPDGSMLASADTGRAIVVWNTRDGSAKVAGGTWVHHNARVNKVVWSPDGEHIASASLDASVVIWNPSAPGVRISIANAHVGGVNAVAWVDNNTVASAGADSSVKTWDIQY